MAKRKKRSPNRKKKSRQIVNATKCTYDDIEFKSKLCSSCGEEKSINDFSKNKYNKDGINGSCKSCVKIKNQKYYAEKREDILKQKKLYHKKNKNKIQSNQKKYRDIYENKEAAKKRTKKWYESNKNKAKEYRKKYRELNRDKINSYNCNYVKKKTNEDDLFKMKCNVRARVYKLLKGGKSKKTQEIIGCSWEQLFIHLNYNNLEDPSHDHIIPLNWAKTKSEVYALARWENLKGMNRLENTSKGSRFCLKKEADWVIKNHPDTSIIKEIINRKTLIGDKYFNKK